MESTNDMQRRIDRYLQEVRVGLRGLTNTQASEIIEELRSHIRDRLEKEGGPTDARVAAALESLGPAAEIAAMYVAETIVDQAEKGFSPGLIFRGVLRWAALSLSGLLVLLGSFAGYALAASFCVSALMKPLAPDRVGLWKVDPDTISLTLGFGKPPVGTELLGWWIVPLGLLIGAGVFLLTMRFGLWGLRKFERMSPVRLH